LFVHVEVQRAPVFLVAGIAGVGVFYNFSLEPHLLEAGAPGPELGAMVCEPTLAEETVLLEVFLGWVRGGTGRPSELSSILSAVQLHAGLKILFPVLNVWVPAELIILALVIVVAVLILSFELGAHRLEWPIGLLSAVEANVTIGVRVACGILNEADASLFLALAAHAVVSLHAESTR
jgi:hypothetical protein